MCLILMCRSNAEDYVHRIGRTGRAGRTGKAFTIAAGSDDEKYLKAIEKLIGKSVQVMELDGGNQLRIRLKTSEDERPEKLNPKSGSVQKEIAKKHTARSMKGKSARQIAPATALRTTEHIPAFLKG